MRFGVPVFDLILCAHRDGPVKATGRHAGDA
jgi:hypothetical protein